MTWYVRGALLGGVMMLMAPLVVGVNITVAFMQPIYAMRQREWAVKWALTVAQDQGILAGHNVR